ncbi:hypothetical protein HDU91_001699, partial [Kappamyces sp. JEL0680]
MLSSIAQNCYKTTQREAQQFTSFVRLANRLEALAPALKDIPFAAQLYGEILAFFQAKTKLNKLSLHFKRQEIWSRLLDYDLALDSLAKSVGAPTSTATERREFEECFAQDLSRWSGAVNQSFEHYMSENSTLEQLVQDLMISPMEYVDTLEMLAQSEKNGKFGQDNGLIPSSKTPLNAVRDYLTLKSNRRVVSRTGIATIVEDELRFLDSRPIGSGSFGEVYVAMWQNQKVAVKRAKEHIVSDEVITMIERWVCRA